MKMRVPQNLDSWAITALRLTQVVSASLQAFPTCITEAVTAMHCVIETDQDHVPTALKGHRNAHFLVYWHLWSTANSTGQTDWLRWALTQSVQEF